MLTIIVPIQILLSYFWYVRTARQRAAWGLDLAIVFPARRAQSDFEHCRTQKTHLLHRQASSNEVSKRENSKNNTTAILRQYIKCTIKCSPVPTREFSFLLRIHNRQYQVLEAKATQDGSESFPKSIGLNCNICTLELGITGGMVLFGMYGMLNEPNIFDSHVK